MHVGGPNRQTPWRKTLFQKGLPNTPESIKKALESSPDSIVAQAKRVHLIRQIFAQHALFLSERRFFGSREQADYVCSVVEEAAKGVQLDVSQALSMDFDAEFFQPVLSWLQKRVSDLGNDAQLLKQEMERCISQLNPAEREVLDAVGVPEVAVGLTPRVKAVWRQRRRLAALYDELYPYERMLKNFMWKTGA